MPNLTTKSHHSRKTETPGKPRRSQKATGEVATPVAPAQPANTEGSSPVSAPSCTVPATTASEPSTSKVVASGVNVMPLVELPNEQQPWYRKPNSPLREQSKKISLMRAAGQDPEAIAKKLHTTTKNVRHVMYIARKNGWLDSNDEPVDVEAEMAFNIDRKVVRNISAALDGGITNWQTHEITKELLKRRVKDVNAEAATQTPTIGVVAIRIEMPAIGAGDQKIVEENVGGTPAYVEGEVVNVRTERLLNGGNESQTDTGALQQVPG